LNVQNGSETLGIGIAGGRFTCGYDTPIYVTNVQPDGCLAKTGQISVLSETPPHTYKFPMSSITSLNYEAHCYIRQE